MLRESVIASSIIALVVIAGAALNGYVIDALLGRGAPFLAGSMLRLATFSAVALLVATAFGIAAWPVVIGVAGAQLVMVGAGVRQGMRA